MKLSLRLAAAASTIVAGLAFAVPAASATPARARKPLWSASLVSKPPGSRAVAVTEAVSPDGKSLFVAGVSGYSPETGPLRGEVIAYKTPSGKVRWQHALQGTKTAHPYNIPSSVTVSPDGATVFVSGSNYVAAYDAATGAQLWTYANLDGAVYSAVSADGATLYVVTQLFKAFALGTATGDLLWTSSVSRLGSDAGAFGGTVSADGTQVVITGSYDEGQGLATADIDAATGVTRWTRFYLGACAGAFLVPGAKVAVSPDGTDVYLSCPDIVIDYASTNGLTRWHETTSTGTSVALSPDGTTLYTAGYGAGGGYRLSALSAATGAAQWSATLGGGEEDEAPALTLSPTGATVYTAGEDTLQAYDAASGAPLWHAQPFAESALVVSRDGTRVFLTGGTSPIVAADTFTTVAYRA